MYRNTEYGNPKQYAHKQQWSPAEKNINYLKIDLRQVLRSQRTSHYRQAKWTRFHLNVIRDGSFDIYSLF